MRVAGSPTEQGPDGGRLSAGWWRPALTSDERNAGRTAAAPWADVAEQVVAAAPLAVPLPAAGVADGRYEPALDAPLRPFVAFVRDRLAEGASRRLAPRHADPGPLADVYAAAVGRQLLCIAGSALQAERQRADDAVARLCTRAGLAAFLGEYPVLARLLGVVSLRAAEAGLELVSRFAADRSDVLAELLGGRDPGPVVGIEPGLDDRHRGGRTAAALSFADGSSVLYRPRDLAVDAAYGRVIEWLNRRVPGAGLRAPAVLRRVGYGWLECVESRPLPGSDSAAEFFWRYGAQLAVLYALRAADLRGESFVACGAVPVLVDAWTLFQPPAPDTGVTSDPGALALDLSVWRAGLAPWAVAASEDDHVVPGGRQGSPGGDRPVLDGEPLDPADYEPALIQGFRAGYDAITADRQAFAGLLAEQGYVEVRTVIRPARGYARLLAESTQAHLLRDARDREEGLAARLEGPAHRPLWRDLGRYELAELRDGDVPLLTTNARAPLDAIAAMRELDRRDQEWVISACLAARRPHSGHRSTATVPGPVTVAAAEPSRLLAAACGVGDQIAARAIGGRGRAGGGRVNWLGLALVNGTRWMLAPMGPSLADGYMGVALFLAQLAALSGIGRYADLARRAIVALPEWLDGLDGSPERVRAAGPGALGGLGGVSYALARMSGQLRDPELGEWSIKAAELAAAADELCAVPGWAAGSAGALAAMGSVQAQTGSHAVGQLATACAERLSGLVERTDGRCAPPDAEVPRGFADGGAGIGWALTRFADAKAQPRYQAAGRRAAGYALGQAGESAADVWPGWCSGSAGLLLGRLCVPAHPGEPESAIARLAARPVLADLGLCHGELGIAEVLAALTAASGGDAGERAMRHRAGLVLDVVSRHGPYCGTPGGIATPGLLNGLAGIGYGLLRFGFPDRVPSALLLEPGPAGLPGSLATTHRKEQAQCGTRTRRGSQGLASRCSLAS